jgi:hypothetical protein
MRTALLTGGFVITNTLPGQGLTAVENRGGIMQENEFYLLFKNPGGGTAIKWKPEN